MKTETIILSDSKAVRDKVNAIFASNGRKVAIVAFVGEDAEAYLGPKKKGIEIYCWPRAGGTNPRSIRDLINKHGCEVHFVNRLHMKIFWSQKAGCVIGSANLTNNALGENGLFEAGVFLPNSASVKIDGIIKYLPVFEADDDSIDKLDREHKAYYAKNGAGKLEQKMRSFSEWYDATPHEKWKLGWWSEEADFPKEAELMAKEEFGGNLKTFLNAKKRMYVKNDWVLSYKVSENSGRIYRSDIHWLYVERFIPTTNNELPEWPYAAVQFNGLKHFGQPPFKIDSKFKEAFAAVAKDLGVDVMTPGRNCIPSDSLVKRIASIYAYGRRKTSHK